MLRWYQKEAIADCLEFLCKKDSGNPLIVCPTGAGKSHILAGLAKEVCDRWGKQNILVLAHRKELLEQNADKFYRAWPECDLGIYSAGLKSREIKQITIAGIQSAFRNCKDFGWQSLVIIDECHLIPKSGEGMYRTMISGLKEVNPKLKIVGLTATPFRLDSGLLCDGEDALFDDICYDIPLKKLIDDGYLSKLRSKESKIQADLSDARTRGGEFINEDIIKIMDEDSLTNAALTEITKLGAGRKSWLLFCTGVRHAEKVCEKLKESGIESACVTGETESQKRAWILDQFKKGKIQAITNCDVLTTGFDAPNIDLLVLLRPTKSAGLYIQMVGRGSRLAPGKNDCLILDFAGNIDRFGPLDAIKIKHQNGKAVTKKEPTKTCPSCEEVLPIAVTRCFSCGFEFQTERAIKHDTKASSAPLFSEEREFVVNYFEAKIHKKEGKPDSVRLNFYCGDFTVSHFLCFQHGGWAQKRAGKWWKDNCVPLGAPSCLQNLDEAITAMKEIPRPKKILCIKDGKYWRLNKVEWGSEADKYQDIEVDELGINI